jgi:hypothetical protein
VKSGSPVALIVWLTDLTPVVAGVPPFANRLGHSCVYQKALDRWARNTKKPTLRWIARSPELPETQSGAYRREPTIRNPMLSAARARRVEGNPFLACGGIELRSMWNAPSDRDYNDPFGAYDEEDKADICGDCGAWWDLGEACEEWCETNQPVQGPSSLAVEEQEVNFFEEARNK